MRKKQRSNGRIKENQARSRESGKLGAAAPDFLFLMALPEFVQI